MNIYLIGYMYSGKTTLGHKLAAKLGYQWLDLDQTFECVFHTSIPIFFKRYGEEAFRKLEQKQLHATADIDNTDHMLHPPSDHPHCRAQRTLKQIHVI